MSMTVLQSGMLSLLQDSGRRGHHRLGLSNGGPLDGEAFHYCNRLLQNPAGSTAIEISVGGLQLQAQVDTYICLTGAPMPLSINGTERALWEVHRIWAGDTIHVGFATAGCRNPDTDLTIELREQLAVLLLRFSQLFGVELAPMTSDTISQSVH